MNPDHILYTTRYEFKIICRSWLFRLVTLLSVIITCSLQIFGRYGIMDMESSGKLFSISEVAHFTTQFLNQFQAFIVLFVVLDSYRREFYATTREAILIRPISNISYTVGKWLGMVGILLYVNILNIFITLVLHLFAMEAPFAWGPYGFYLLFWLLPTLMFVSALAYLITHIIRNTFIALSVSLLFLYMGINHLPYILSGTFDPFADQITSLFSELSGYPERGMYLTQRLTYILWGIALLLTSISFSKRIPNKVKTLKHTRTLAAWLLITGGVCCYYHGYTRQNEYTRRAAYQHSYLAAEHLPKVHTQKHDITFEQKGKQIHLTSKIIAENKYTQALTPVILYLNPRLDITSLTNRGNGLKFRRDNQIIYIDTTLLPGDSLCLEIKYQGGIDGQICYPDIPEAEYHRSLQYKQFAYTGQDYTLLTPECLWYPTSRPPVTLNDPYAVVEDFTYFNLSVNHPKNKTAISQGNAQKIKTGTSYTNRIPLSGITLIIGEYEKKSLQVDSTYIEGYYWKIHQHLASKLPQITPADVRQAQATVIHTYQRDLPPYPYSKLVFAETPEHFTSWYRPWKRRSEFVQPEMVLVSERGKPIFYTPFPKKDETVRYVQGILLQLHERVKSYFTTHRIAMFLQNIFRIYSHPEESIYSSRYNNYYLSNNAVQLVQVHDTAIPVLNHIVQLLLQAHANLINFHSQAADSPQSSYSMANAYLTTHSLADLPNSTLPIHLTETVLQQKAMELYLHLHTTLSQERYNLFIERLLSTYRFQEISRKQFCQIIEEYANIGMDKYLTNWYKQSGLPTYRFRDVQCTPYVTPEGDTRYQISVKIQNDSDREGHLSLRETIHANAHDLKKYYIIAPHSFNEILFTTEYPTQKLYIDMGTARNNPTLTALNVEQKPLSPQKGKEGIFPTDSSCFISQANEIIVDNMDPGFKLIAPPQRKKLTDYFRIKHDKWTDLNDKIVTSVYSMKQDKAQWEYAYNPNFHGDVEKTAFQIEAGNGEFKAEWTTDLPHAGRYHIYCYIPPINKMQMRQNGTASMSIMLQEWPTYFNIRGGEYLHEIEHTTIAQETGWVLLGTFNLPKGESKVILDNRGLPGTLVYADAIKWELTEKVL